MKKIIFASVELLLIFLVISCSELKKEFPAAPGGELSVHDAGWGSDTSSAGFHGKYLDGEDWIPEDCAPCHGERYGGGTSGVSCFKCHPSFPHDIRFASGGGHPGYMRDNGYPLANCKSCHGESLSGGARVKASCSAPGCHRDAAGQPKSPESCNTCHGVFAAAADSVSTWAPPESILGDTSVTARGVGAHQKHLAAGTLGMSVKCAECHAVPGDVAEAGHIDTPFSVLVAFNDSMASLKTSGGTVIPSPLFSSANMSCGNVYCHGYFLNGNLANSPVWNSGDGLQARCGTCHGDPADGNPLPGGTHLQGSGFNTCQNCHFTGSDPVARYSAGTWSIIDRSKHINGKLSKFGSEAPF